MAAKFRAYGHQINDCRLAEVAIFLYKASRADSTRKSYSVGQRHWVRFQSLHPEIAFFPFTTVSPDPVSLSLCFFAAYLASRPKIKRYTTVRSYICHVKALWRDAGCSKVLLDSPLLAAVMRGVRRALPAPPDLRAAFILPLYTSPSYYITPPSIEWLLLKAAVALGFHAMLRFGAFCQLTPSSLTVILNDGDEWPLHHMPSSLFTAFSTRLLGFRFTFTPKYTSSDGRVTSAYFCHICDIAPDWQAHCPVCAILLLRTKHLFRFPTRPIFDPKILTPTALSSYLALIAGRSRVKSSDVFKPHSLRIGGHTFYTMHGMSADLRDYLARRVISRCSMRYYRASPVCNLQALRDFYAALKPNHP